MFSSEKHDFRAGGRGSLPSAETTAEDGRPRQEGKGTSAEKGVGRTDVLSEL